MVDEGDAGLEVADENHVAPTNTCAGYLNTEQCFSDSAPDTLSQTYRRGSYRYKDRINTLRMQSKETYQREHMVGPTFFT